MLKTYQPYKYIFALAIPLAFFVVMFAANAQGVDDALKGLDNTAKSGYGVSNPETELVSNVPSAIGKVLGAGLAFIGVIFFILMIYGGVIWMFARGNDQEVAKAKDLITSAIIGLVIVLAAYAITYYIGQVLTS
jgi:cbb3-type cytochrome oxidase subunit 3